MTKCEFIGVYRPRKAMKILVVFFVLLVMCVSVAKGESCTSPCITNYAQCGISKQCEQACVNKPEGLLCVEANQQICPPVNSSQVTCWTKIGIPHCSCLNFVASCHLGSDEQLEAGGVCKISKVGIALSVVCPIVFLILVGACVWCCRSRRDKRRKYKELRSEDARL